ncbi:hypothetical protein OQJ13_07975 [Legionella sp. PATHC035]|uniref:hypothetical protein n=1 Tax=Legionella sp. PATHC035 TaxID=2992040 RepID=UPI0022445334|nr:hypothetical protein [Legionella sp. PATHC035]MCW8408907.1 hypothetical protein [Legionella sp. PATHC035]
MKRVLCAIYLILFVSASLATPQKIYDINFEDDPNSVSTLDLVFYGQLPAPEVVDKILRESLQHAILVYPNKDILATSFLGDEVLNPNQYSGMLVYKAKLKKILTFGI